MAHLRHNVGSSFFTARIKEELNKEKKGIEIEERSEKRAAWGRTHSNCAASIFMKTLDKMSRSLAQHLVLCTFM